MVKGRGIGNKVFRGTSRALMATLLVSTAISISLAVTHREAAAQTQAQTSFSVPAGPLNRALTAFGRQAGVQVTYLASAAAGKTSSGFSGSATREQALAGILAGSGLVYSFPNATTVAISTPAAGSGNISADGSTVLETITVQGESAWGPVDGIVAKRSATGTKTDTPIEKVPQTVNVVTADEITIRGATSVAQALRYTPGVSTSGYTESYMIADEAVTRGFSPSSNYLDGAFLPYPGSLGGALQIDPFTLERIEVLKGPASVLYGQNEPGGIINMVSKRPTETPVREVRVRTGTYGRTEAAVDFGGPVTKDNTLLYRFIGLGNLGDDQIDFTERSRMLFAPSLTWQPTAQTSLTISGQYQRDNDVNDYQALPYIGTVVPGPDGRYIDRDLFTGEPGWNDYKRDQYVLGADLTHEFSDTLKFKSTVRYFNVQDEYKGMYPWWFADVDGVTDYSKVTRAKVDWIQNNSTFSFDNNLTYEVETGDIKHTVLAGVDYRYTRLAFQKFERIIGSEPVA
ncbi:TonB-dependent receptor plug domain-containing protein [Ochrobactrum pecoris]|nr:TonB-dependent receptor plug domain-containing protein [Brucella pecoris]